MKISTLAVFDFDGTLFRSPQEPAWWPEGEKGNFYLHQDSLGRPCVPDHPDDSWWIGSVVIEARKALTDPFARAVLCTGRVDNLSFRWRVPELLKQKGLDFDGVFLNRKSSVKEHKASTVKQILVKIPSIKVVKMWDDDQKNLDAVEAVVTTSGMQFESHLIRSTPKPLACGPETYLEENPWSKDPAKRVALRWIKRNA
jgi:hypothetical protein